MALVSDQEFCSFEEEPEMALVIGQEFCSFEELSESVKKWENTNFVTLYTRSSRSIEGLRLGLGLGLGLGLVLVLG